jgi:hypothetical protein
MKIQADPDPVYPAILQKHQHGSGSNLAYDRKKEKALKSGGISEVLTFDMQQCLPILDVKAIQVFYKHQLWAHNLTVSHIEKNHTIV